MAWEAGCVTVDVGDRRRGWGRQGAWQEDGGRSGGVPYLGAGSGGGMRTLNENPVNKVANYGETLRA